MRDAHDAAVDAALAVLEDEACRVRRGRGGARVLAGDGFVAAAFRHRTSRAGDPHLHTHVVVANLAHARATTAGRALDGRQLYAWCRTVGYLYEAHLRAELTRRLGVEWEPSAQRHRRCRRDLERAIEHFSQRRRQIIDRMAEIGSLGGHAAQVATYATRQAKDTSVPYAALHAVVERARGRGSVSTTRARRRLRRHRPAARRHETTADVDHLYRRLDAPDGLTEHRSTFDRRDVIRHLCDELPAGAATTDVLDLADDYLGSHHVVALAERGTERIHRADGRSAPVPTDAHRWTTPDMLRVERRSSSWQRTASTPAPASPEPITSRPPSSPTDAQRRAAGDGAADLRIGRRRRGRARRRRLRQDPRPRRRPRRLARHPAAPSSAPPSRPRPPASSKPDRASRR